MKPIIKLACITCITLLTSCIVQDDTTESFTVLESSFEEISSSDMQLEPSSEEEYCSFDTLPLLSSSDNCPVIDINPNQCDKGTETIDMFDENSCLLGTICVPIELPGPDDFFLKTCKQMEGYFALADMSSAEYEKLYALYEGKCETTKTIDPEDFLLKTCKQMEGYFIVADMSGTEYEKLYGLYEGKCETTKTIDPEDFLLKTCKQMEGFFIVADMSVTEYEKLYGLYEDKCVLIDTTPVQCPIIEPRPFPCEKGTISLPDFDDNGCFLGDACVPIDSKNKDKIIELYKHLNCKEKGTNLERELLGVELWEKLWDIYGSMCLD